MLDSFVRRTRGEEGVALIIAVPRADGTPPYIVKWLSDGHIAMVVPDHHMRVERADDRPALS